MWDFDDRRFCSGYMSGVFFFFMGNKDSGYGGGEGLFCCLAIFMYIRKEGRPSSSREHKSWASDLLFFFFFFCSLAGDRAEQGSAWVAKWGTNLLL